MNVYVKLLSSLRFSRPFPNISAHASGIKQNDAIMVSRKVGSKCGVFIG